VKEKLFEQKKKGTMKKGQRRIDKRLDENNHSELAEFTVFCSEPGVPIVDWDEIVLEGDKKQSEPPEVMSEEICRSEALPATLLLLLLHTFCCGCCCTCG